MDKMDVDPVGLGLKCALPNQATLSTEERLKFGFPQSMLAKINKGMADNDWQHHIGVAESDPSKWSSLFSDVLVHITSHLSESEMNASFIPDVTRSQAKGLVNDHEFEEWKSMVRKCVESKDWALLIRHRMWFTLDLVVAHHHDSETQER